MKRTWFLSPLGRHVHQLLQDRSAWQLEGTTIKHTSGLALNVRRETGDFDVEDEGGKSDFIKELTWLDSVLLWPLARDLRMALKFPEIHNTERTEE